ncbi:DUF2681 domain-containing protein [Oligella urethralis]|uniref:DUF2681 domain-containing protein n=1 Tax=Oligella urethralis TaxID=90245 RepID=UPI002889E9B6|nr:DUF2681 domain-containing protein [Oligella urethralis]
MMAIYITSSVVGVLIMLIAFLVNNRNTLKDKLTDAQHQASQLRDEISLLKKEVKNAQVRKEINAEVANVADDELTERMRIEGYYRR